MPESNRFRLAAVVGTGSPLINLRVVRPWDVLPKREQQSVVPFGFVTTLQNGHNGAAITESLPIRDGCLSQLAVFDHSFQECGTNTWVCHLFVTRVCDVSLCHAQKERLQASRKIPGNPKLDRRG